MKIIIRAVSFALCVFTAVFVALFAVPETKRKYNPFSSGRYKTVLTVWHIDTFEGGTGSRADFLGSSLKALGDDGIVTLVKTQTAESMEKAFKNGELPDMISFGVGAGEIINSARELPFKSFAGGEAGGRFLAVPWCFGGYYLIAKNADNRLIDRLFENDSDKNIENLIVSDGENILPVLALKQLGITANAVYLSPKDAYSQFLSEKNALLLGTQRDIKRIEKKKDGFAVRPLEGYSDLVQYIAITTESDEKYRYCVLAAEHILSEEVQKKLYKIGMMRTDGKTDDEADFYGYDFSKNEYTLSPFLSKRLIADAKSEINTAKINVKISENVKSGLKRLK